MMRQIVNGKLYDTEKAQLVASDRYWDGHNWERHGRNTYLYKTAKGNFFLYHTTLWQGERDWAEIITPEQALQEILKSGNMELLEEERFSELKALYEKTIIQEEEVPQK